MRTLLITFLLSVCSANLFAFNGDEDVALFVEFKGDKVVRGTRVLLKDLAGIVIVAPQGVNPKVIKYRAESIEVAKFRGETESLVVSQETIRSLLVKAGFNTTGIEINGPLEVRISRKMMQITSRRVIEMAKRHVRNALAGIDENAKVNFVRILPTIKVPAARWNSELRFENDPKNLDFLGDVNLRLVVELDGFVQQLAIIPIRVKRIVHALRLVRLVRKGSPIRREDVVLEERETARLGPQLFFSADDVVGLIAVRDLPKGKDILRTDLRSVTIVEAGDFLTVKVRAGLLTVETVCEAQQSGSAGDRIRLLNLKSKREFHAVIVDARNAEIKIAKEYR